MNIIEIPLTKGYVATIDAEDYPLVSQYKWSSDVQKHTVYASNGGYKNGRNHKILMHRLILGLKRGDRVITDHEDRNGLNNRRLNIRKSTSVLNVGRAIVRREKAPFRGIGRQGNGWQATIRHHGQSIYLGYFTNPEDAAIGYDAAAQWLRREHAELNFP